MDLIEKYGEVKSASVGNYAAFRAAPAREGSYNLRERVEALESELTSVKGAYQKAFLELYERVQRLETETGTPWEPGQSLAQR